MTDTIHDRSVHPFIAIDLRVLELPLSEKAFRVYAQLKKYANSEGKCFPSQGRLGRECFPSMTESSARVTAAKALKELEELGLLSKKNNLTEGKGMTSNTYTLLEPPCNPTLHPPVIPRYTPCNPTLHPPVIPRYTPCNPTLHPPVIPRYTPCNPTLHKLDPYELDPYELDPPYSPPEKNQVEPGEEKRGGVFSGSEESLDRSTTLSTQESVARDECGIDSPLPTSPPINSGCESKEESSALVQKTNKGDALPGRGNIPKLGFRVEKTQNSAAKPRPMSEDELDLICGWLREGRQVEIANFQNGNRGKVYWPWLDSPDRRKRNPDRRFVEWVGQEKFGTTAVLTERLSRSKRWILDRSLDPDISMANKVGEITSLWYDYLREKEIDRERDCPPTPTTEPNQNLATADSLKKAAELNPKTAALYQKMRRQFSNP